MIRDIPDDGVPIGYPVTDMRFEIRDEAGKPAPKGIAGEIVVHSRFLALGYWNDAAATARAFEPEAGNSERTYRTGDVGRIAEDGSLEYLGRADGRVRIRGQWIEPAVIETELCTIPSVRDAVVVAQTSKNADQRLVVYYVSTQDAAPSESELRSALASRLPGHMIPARYLALRELPLNANGKIDRAALPKPTTIRPGGAASWMAPVDLIQLRMCQIWEDLLGVVPVGIRDDFFELGGDSLLALQMLDRVDSAFGCSVPVSSLLSGGTSIERLARLLMTGSSEMEAPIVPIRAAGSREPFFFLHGDYMSGGIYCRELARYLHPEQPFYVIPPCGLDGQSIPLGYELMAARHLEHLRKVRPRGPYMLGGECNGGLVAYEMARLLEVQGEHVSLLMLLSASAQNVRFAKQWARLESLAGVVGVSRVKQDYLRRRVGEFTLNQHGVPAMTVLSTLCRKLPHLLTEFGTLVRQRANGSSSTRGLGTFGTDGYRDQIRAIYQEIDRSYLPGRFGGGVTLIMGREEIPDIATERGWWRTLAANVEAIEVPGNSTTKLTRHVGELGRVMDRLLGERSVRI